MSIIYPPHIASTIPAFDSKIIVPFTDNAAVRNYGGLAIMIHDLQNNKIATGKCTTANITDNPEIGMCEASFEKASLVSVEGRVLNYGQYYKIQIAYMESSSDNNSDLYFSSASIGRHVYAIEPTVTISGLKVTANVAIDKRLQSEIPYQYRFRLGTDEEPVSNLTEWTNFKEDEYDDLNSVVSTTYTIDDHSLFGKGQYIWFETKTINGYYSSAKEELGNLDYNQYPIDGMQISFNLEKEEKEEGYVKLAISNITNFDKYKNIDVVRAQVGSETWETIYSFSGVGEIICYDSTVESGLDYKYGLIAKGTDNNYYYYFKEDNEAVTPYFEDIFLSDGDRELKVRFNPKVSSFKETVVESKQDTIGGRYPFFFRNGDVRYKEIPISGLLSYQLDENQKFISDKELGLETESEQIRQNTPAQVTDTKKQHLRTTSLAHYNITAERKFKLAVLEWLNNGKPKLFRSPTEGNYIVRLMNISLQPEEKLGRMLHSFSATGYECMEINEENLRELGIVKTSTINGGQQAVTTTFGMRETAIGYPIYYEGFGQIYSLSFSGDGDVQITYNKPYKGVLTQTFNPSKQNFVFDAKMSIKNIKTDTSIQTKMTSSRTPKIVATGANLDTNFYLNSSTLGKEEETV